MTISASTVGTPQQTVVPVNQIATVEAGAVKFPDQNSSSRALKLPSAAGIPSYFAYWMLCNAMNPGVWVFYSFDPNDIATAQALSNASEQEWVSNPASGHNTVLS